LFLSPGERRLRSGWRLLIQTILLLLLALCAGTAILLPYTFLAGRDISGLSFILLNEAIKLIAITPSIVLARRFLDKRSFASLGLKIDLRAGFDLLAGLLVSFLMMGAIFLTFRSLGWLRFQGFAWQAQSLAPVIGQSLLMLLIFTSTGWNEELLSRGYHLQTFASGTSTAWGVVFSSIIFGVMHLTNPGASWIAGLGIFFSGLFLAIGYLLTGQLWISIGLHIGWNFFEGTVFGFTVSGIDFYRITNITVHGPQAWTGGAFGPESGLIILPAIVLGSLLVFSYSKLRSRFLCKP
jgi:membrane protease YdiL (CAAX protease family)